MCCGKIGTKRADFWPSLLAFSIYFLTFSNLVFEDFEKNLILYGSLISMFIFSGLLEDDPNLVVLLTFCYHSVELNIYFFIFSTTVRMRRTLTYFLFLPGTEHVKRYQAPYYLKAAQ